MIIVIGNATEESRFGGADELVRIGVEAGVERFEEELKGLARGQYPGAKLKFSATEQGSRRSSQR